MFSPLAKYSDEKFFNKHRTIYLLTPHESMRLTVIAANVADADVEKLRLKFADDDGSSADTDSRDDTDSSDFHKYWHQLLKKSEVVADDAPNTPGQVFAFMTYSYETSSSRTLCCAVRVS